MRLQETSGLSQILSHTKHEMRQQMDAALKPLGLSAAQYSALSALEERDTQTNADLARACFVTPQTMIRMVKEFKTRGFIKETHTQGLKVHFELSRKALDILCKAHVVIDKLERRMTKGFSRKDVERLLNDLKVCFANLLAEK